MSDVRHRALPAALAAIALLAAACSPATTTASDESASASIAADASEVELAEPTAAPTPTTAPEPRSTVPLDATTEAETSTPVLSWADGRQVGDCFNSDAPTSDGERPGEAVDCQGEHQYEIFFVGDLPDPADAPFRTNDSFVDVLFVTFCDPAVEEFAGTAVEAVPFVMSVWTPFEDTWTTGDRTFACAAEAGLPAENRFKIGTAAGGDLTSDEGIVSRATVNGQTDLYFSFQGSTIYPLTSGEHEFANQTPKVLSVGFLFAAPRQSISSDEIARAYSYGFDDNEITPISTGLDGWDLASPQFVRDIPAFVVAARENIDDDWELYLSSGPDDVTTLTENDADDQWPSLTPDETQIVFNRDDDIWIMNIDGTKARQLTSDPAGDFESAVSPDGQHIVFTSDRSGNDDIWIMNIDGSEQRNLTSHPGNDAWPFFDAGGETVYFETDRLGVKSNIMMMNLDGSNQSYFSFEWMTNGAVLPAAVADRYRTELAPVRSTPMDSTRIVPGLANETTEIAHSSGRLRVKLPGTWSYTEVDTDDDAAMVAAPDIDVFNDTWAADGAQLAVIDVPRDEFATRLSNNSAAADSDCDQTGESDSVDGTQLISVRRYECGAGSNVLVVGIYGTDTAVGMLFEGQWDGDPDFEADEDLITRIARSIRWG